MQMLASAAVLVALLWPAGAGAEPERFSAAREMIVESIEEGRLPSVAVAVARGRKIVWEEAFGWADREREVPAGVHSRYSLASASKPFTATALMVLVERGEIHLDRPVNDYLGGAGLRARVGEARRATVRRVANHTAGLPLHFQFFAAGEEPPRPPMEVTLRRYGTLITAPGERYFYSNLGYGVLEHAIEKVSGRTLAEFLQEEVFAPWGLEHAEVAVSPGEGLAARYSNAGEPLPFYDSDHRGGSAVWACVHDLVRFGMLHLGTAPRAPRVLSKGSLRAMRKPTGRRPGRAGGYGIGWEIQERQSRSLVLHTGGMPGASAILVLLPSARVVVAVVANVNSDLTLGIAEEILSSFLPRADLGWPRAKLRAGRPGPSPSGGRAQSPPARLEGSWSGWIDLSGRRVPLSLEVSGSEGVRVGFAGEPAQPLLSLDPFPERRARRALPSRG